MVTIMSETEATKRTFKTSSIADIARGINNRAFRRFGFARSEILMHWPEIVGPVLARSSLPERLVTPKQNEQTDTKAGVLHIRVDGSFAPEMQHLEPLVIDRINSYYGFNAVCRLICHHGIIDKQAPLKKYQPPILTDSQKSELDLCLKDIKDDKLRESLFKVGAELVARQKPLEVKKTKRFTRRGQGGLDSES
tara:strand:+ start:16933 stop:17514 length:582 start_codon:yes stop_codon:yes gene_type:complete